MTTFRSILVAIDIDDEAVADTGRAAIAEALAIARSDGASITLAHVIDVAGDVRAAMLRGGQSDASRRYADIARVLRDIAAAAPGIAVKTAILFGSHWLEIVREVLRAGHDLVVIGTKRRGVTGRALFGSTGNKLLRTCPCPVWVAKAAAYDPTAGVLVAHDMTAVGAAALEIGASVARRKGALVHVLHAIEHPEAARFLSAIDARARTTRIRDAREVLEVRARQYGLEPPPEVTVVEGNAYAAILEYLRAREIGLLVMGTVARTGVGALLTGNTAENVLPWVECSVIAIKPESFRCPVESVAADRMSAVAPP